MKRRDFLKMMLLSLSSLACRLIGLLPTQQKQPLATPLQVSPSTHTDTPFQSAVTVNAPSSATHPVEQVSVEQATATPPVGASSWIVIDGHQDIAWNALEFGRDPRRSALAIRLQEANGGLPEMIGERTTGMPEYLTGRVGLIFATIFVMPAQFAYPGYHAMTYSNPEQAKTRAQQQLDFYDQLVIQEPRFLLVTSQADLEVVLSSWTQTANQLRVGLMLLMEGADPLRTPDEVRIWHQAGLRVIGPAWHATRYSGGTGEPGPLSDLGRQLLSIMAELKMVLDLSHMAETAYLEAVERYASGLIASHSNPRKFLPTDRGLSDEMIRKLVVRDGVIGITLYNAYLKPGWARGDPRREVTLEKVVEAIDYVVQLVGDAQHVAIGSDMDGGFGREAIPFEMDTCADLVKIVPLLEQRGYSGADIQAILNGNWLRILRGSLP